MSIFQPPDDWFQKPSGGEKLWIGISLIWCLIMFFMMPYWHFKGKQNSTGEAYRLESPMQFMERVNKFVAEKQVGEENGLPIVEPEPNGDAYLLGQRWIWQPILKLKAGETYRLHVSSLDLQHGLGILPINMNFQILPGYDHVLTITPRKPGDYQLVCNEFCDVGHHTMTGKIIVE